MSEIGGEVIYWLIKSSRPLRKREMLKRRRERINCLIENESKKEMSEGRWKGVN
jgi:hypothetical protein